MFCALCCAQFWCPDCESLGQEAKFLAGERYVATGSDCGHLYVYEKLSGKLARIIRADCHVVNGLAPHPHLPLVATCGIDSDVKVFDLGHEFADMRKRASPPASVMPSCFVFLS